MPGLPTAALGGMLAGGRRAPARPGSRSAPATRNIARPGMAPVTDGTGTSATGPSQRRAFEGLHLDGLRCSLFVPFNGELRKTVRLAPRRPTGHEEDNRNLGASATLIRWFTHPSASCAGDALRRSAITAASCAGE